MAGMYPIPPLAVLACAALLPAAALAQGKLGSYTGTVKVSGSEFGTTSRVAFAGDVKIALPITSSSDGGATAQVDDVDKPSATARITRWDSEGRNAGPDADGKVTTWKCSLAAPVEVPMNASGVMHVSRTTKKYSMFVGMAARKPVQLDCVNSRTGPYKKAETMGLFFGTNEPGVAPMELPYTDPARLAAKHRLVPIAQMKGRFSPLEQEWDLRLAK